MCRRVREEVADYPRRGKRDSGQLGERSCHIRDRRFAAGIGRIDGNEMVELTAGRLGGDRRSS